MTQYPILRRVWTLAAVLTLALAGSAYAADDGKAKESKEKPKPYPLDVCAVSGEKLGEMGKPVVIEYEGREIKFCCTHCEPEFKKDPKKYLKKIDDAAAKKKEAAKKEGGADAK
jgi:YHS domain-containing protein